LFFVVGSARSGTTLLRMILNAHSEIAVPPESRFVVELWNGRSEVDVESFLGALARHPRWNTWGLPIETVRRELEGARRVPYRAAIEAAYRAYARVRHKTKFGDKTPRYIEQIPLLARLFPRARFVHQIRDGRNVALSYAAVPFGPGTVAGAAELWAARVSQGRAAGRSLGPRRYMEIHYEDLVRSPEPQVEALCRFLEVAFEPGMVRYTDMSQGDVLSRHAHYNPHVTRPPIPQVRSWEQEMSVGEIEMFEAVAGDVLSEVGYPRRFPAPRRRARLAASLARRGLPIGRLAARAARPDEASSYAAQDPTEEADG
jgi:hypothetical protein